MFFRHNCVGGKMYAETAVTDISPISVCYSGCFGKLCRRHKPIAGYLKIYSQYLVDTEARLAMAFFVLYFLSDIIIVREGNICFFINGMDTKHAAMYNHGVSVQRGRSVPSVGIQRPVMAWTGIWDRSSQNRSSQERLFESSTNEYLSSMRIITAAVPGREPVCIQRSNPK